MLIHPTMEKLRELKLNGMMKALQQQQQIPDINTLSFEDRLGLLVDHQLTERDNKNFSGRLKAAKLKHQACIENINYKQPRGIDKSTIVQLATCDWIVKHRNVFITGATGSGKTFIVTALAHKACQLGFRALYVRTPRLLDDLVLARADGSYNKLLLNLAKLDLLALDDFGLVPMTDEMARDFLEVIDDRAGTRSTIFASQLPHESWHQTIMNPTLGDAIIDRVVHNSYKIKLKTKESMKKGDQIEE